LTDTWPHTGRPLPWLLAAFLAMLFLLPVAGIKFNIPTPIAATPDRVFIGAMVVAVVIAAMRGPVGPALRRPVLFRASVAVFVAIAFISLAANAHDIVRQDLVSITQGRVVMLLGFVAVAVYATSVLRPEEIRNFGLLLVILGTVMAAGVVVERRLGYNVFYELLAKPLNAVASVAPTPTETNPDPTRADRKVIVGPTEHGLAVTSMFALVMPFALVGLSEARGSTRWWYGISIALMLGAALSTERKTGVIAPVAAAAVFAAYRPRAAVRMLPLLLLMLVFIKVSAPGALGTVFELQSATTSNSTAGRSDDFAAVAPEFLARPLLGGGYGTRDIERVYEVRILDDEYLGELLSVGLIGVFAFFAMIVSTMLIAHRLARSRDPVRANLALACSAACFVFLVVNVIFDSLSFSQVPYLFFVIAAMGTVLASRPA
jgi:hypothetical protein